MTDPSVADSAHVVVSSPLQLLNAREAIGHLGLGTDTRLTAIVADNSNSLGQLHRVLDHTRLGAQANVLAAPSIAAKWAWLHREARRLVDTLVIGEYRLALLRELAQRLSPRRIAVVDDGNATLLWHAHREGRIKSSLRLSGARQVWRDRLQRLAGIRGVEPRTITYVTIYDIDSQRDRVVRHSYEELRAATSQPDSSAPPALMGSALANSGAMTFDAYLTAIARICNAANPPAVYHPHRRETNEQLRAVESLGLHIVPLRGPAELEFRLATAPRRIDAFPSTIVDTLPIVLGPNVPIRVIVPSGSSINPSARPGIERVLAYTREHAPDWVSFETS